MGEMRPSPDGPDRKYFSLSDAGKERLGEFWDQWQELVTKVERIKKEGKNGRKLYRKMSDEVIHLKKEDQAYVKKWSLILGLSPIFMMMKHSVNNSTIWFAI